LQRNEPARFEIQETRKDECYGSYDNNKKDA